VPPIVRKLLIGLALCCCAGGANAGAYDDILAAANSGDTVAVIDLIKRGMDVNTADPRGTTLLMIAVRNGNISLMEALLASRANVNRRNQFGDTALGLAALSARYDAVHGLIEKGADLNPSGWTPLHYAVFGGSKEVAALLVAKGAKLDARAPNGQTALMIAVKLGKLELVEQLIDADADMDLADYDGMTALQLAIKLGHGEIAAYLRKVGAVE
jgi:ankyrin repeat protein